MMEEPVFLFPLSSPTPLRTFEYAENIQSRFRRLALCSLESFTAKLQDAYLVAYAIKFKNKRES